MLIRDDHEFHFTLKGSVFEFRSVRLPKTMTSAEENNEPDAAEGRLLDRISLYEICLRTTDELFKIFLKRRTGSEWSDELVKLRAWIHKAN